MALRHRTITLSLSLLCIAAILLVAKFRLVKTALPQSWPTDLVNSSVDTCPDRLEWLSSLDIAFPINYAYRDIVVAPRDIPRESITKLAEPLFSAFQEIDLSTNAVVELKHCLPPITLDVPAFTADVNASHIIFGISTTLQRLEDSIPSLRRWLSYSHARLIVIVIEAEQDGATKAVAADLAKKTKLETRLRTLGIDATLVNPINLQESFSEKYFSLVKIMYEQCNDETQWVATIDDDTFFPSLKMLGDMLRKYEDGKRHYVGALSENWWAVVHYGMMAFGGAGIFLSREMAKVIHEHYRECQQHSHASAGDIRILECVYIISNTKLSNERDLHQIDIWADLSGLLESGRMPLSLHHWKPGAALKDGYDIPMQHTVADICQECYLQRWQFGTEMILTNGFSIAFYPHGDLKKVNLDFTEETWDKLTQVEGSNNGGTDHSLGPTREKLVLDEQKIQYLLVYSAVVAGDVRQVYWHSGTNGEMDSVLELTWRDGSTASASNTES